MGLALNALLLVAAQVAPAVFTMKVFAVQMLPLPKDSGEEVTGCETGAEVISSSLQVGRMVFRDHCSFRGESMDEGAA